MADESDKIPPEMQPIVDRFLETATMPTEPQEKPEQSFPWSQENLNNE